MNKWIQWVWLALIVLVAAALRLSGIDWDKYRHYHPDERYITWVATTIEWPSEWSTALNPAQSSFNPFYWPPDAASAGIEVEQDRPRRFAYGHFPLYLGVGLTRLIERLGPAAALYLPADWLLTQDILNGHEWIEFFHLTVVGRALTGLVDVGTVGLIFLLGRQLYGAAVGLLAAAFLALNVMHIQLAHFFAFDPYMTFFVVAAIYFMVMSYDVKRKALSERRDGGSGEREAGGALVTFYLLLAAIGIGLAVGSKFAAVLLFVPLLLTLYLVDRDQWLWRALGLAGVVFLVFCLTNPFAILDLTCEVITPAVKLGPVTIPALDWRSCFLSNIATQGAMVRGDTTLAFTTQYSGTLPYLYTMEMQWRWGMGPLLGLAAWAGFAWAMGRLALWGWATLKGRPWVASHSSFTVRRAEFILLAWAVPFFLITGSFYVKFMRYLQPLTPFLMIYAAAMLLAWKNRMGRRIVVAAILIVTGLYALSFVNLYSLPHPWITASQWVYANVRPGALILSEQWDDALPDSLTIDGVARRRSEYHGEQLTWLTGIGAQDDEAKLAANLALLAEAEYLTLVTNRIYGVAPRLPELYPISSQYHQLLFDGSLGYEPVFVNGRAPGLAGFHLRPDTFGWPGLRPPALVAGYLTEQLPGVTWGRADESFLVYDQPLTIIFRNSGRLTAEEMGRRFELD